MSTSNAPVGASHGDEPKGAGSERHFSGIVVSCLLSYLHGRGGRALVDEVLDRAGERRSPDRLASVAEWSSYSQVKRLLSGAAAVCGQESLTAAGIHVLDSMGGAAQTQSLHTLESPGALLEQVSELGSQISTVLAFDANQVAANEWIVTQRFVDGFEPFDAYCQFQAGMLSTIPRLYGYPLATIVEEACQCDGAPATSFRFTWEEVDELRRRVSHLEFSRRLLETRLDSLVLTTTELVGSHDPATVLERIVATACRSVLAPAYVLALRSPPPGGRQVYSNGLDKAVAVQLAARLLHDDTDPPGILSVNVRSTMSDYGCLAAVDPTGVRAYLHEERKVLEAQASVAAAALDVAGSLDGARHQEALLTSIVDRLPHGVGWTDSSGAMEGCNHALAELLGCRLDEVRGRTLSELCPERRLADDCQQWIDQVANNRAPVINAEAWVSRDDDRRELLVSMVPLSDDEKDGRLVTIWADVTDERSMEQRLAESSRLESIGQLAAGIAHEINTPMQYIGDNSAFLDKAYQAITPLIDQLAEQALAHGAERHEIDQLFADAKLDRLRNRIPRAAEQVGQGIEAVGRIVRALKTLAHPGGDDFEPVDLAHVLESSITVARSEWKYVAELDLDIASGLPAVRAIPGMINQVLLNLIVNAAHAIDDRRAADGTIELGRIAITGKVLDGRVEIRVGDDGGGIPEPIKEKIYDQFFTTKGVGKGTGQGLAICRRIVDDHDGSIDFTTSTSGTTFIIRLPIWDPAIHLPA